MLPLSLSSASSSLTYPLLSHLDAQGAAELRPAPGKRQYVNQKPPGASVDDGEEADANQMMLVRPSRRCSNDHARLASNSVQPTRAPVASPLPDCGGVPRLS